MRRQVAFPFLTLPEAAVRFDGFLVGDPGKPLVPASDIFENWDYERDIEVRADLEIDFTMASKALHIPEDELMLSAILKTGTGSGTFPRQIEYSTPHLFTNDSPKSTLSAIHNSAKLSSRLWIQLSLTQRKISSVREPLSPNVVGARLWSSELDVLLEDGGDARFPIELVSFSSAFVGQPHVRSLWYLDWRFNDIDADFSGAVRIYVNSDMPRVSERFVEGDLLTLQSILGDVMSQMISLFLDHSEKEVAMGEYSPNSVAFQILNWIEMAFPSQSITSVKSLRDHKPGSFRAAILASAEIGEP